MKLTAHRVFYLLMATGVLLFGLSIILPTMLSGWLFTFGLLTFAAGFILRWFPWSIW